MAGETGERTSEEVAWATKMPQQHRAAWEASPCLYQVVVEEYKCTKKRMDMTLRESGDPYISDAVLTLVTVKKWDSAPPVADENTAIRRRYIVLKVQQGRGGLGLRASTPTMQKATSNEFGDRGGAPPGVSSNAIPPKGPDHLPATNILHPGRRKTAYQAFRLVPAE